MRDVPEVTKVKIYWSEGAWHTKVLPEDEDALTALTLDISWPEGVQPIAGCSEVQFGVPVDKPKPVVIGA